MSIPKIAKAMGYIDDDLITGAIEYKRTKKKKVWVMWGALAACLCLMVGGTIIWHKTSTSGKKGNEIVISENGVTIPKMDISLSAKESADMVAFFIYQGNCYVQYGQIDNNGIIGEYLGTATGLIDEWTPKKGYVELAGNVEGDFFTVKGYDPSFMLCKKDETGTVSTYICNNGITLKYGADLYENRLHLSDHYSAVQYETRDSWFFDKNDLYQINGKDEVIGNFIEQLDKAEFIPWDDIVAQEGQTTSSMINEKEIYHVYFKLSDGTTVHLRLYENGYARFQGLLDVGVRIPEESFSPLIDLMDNHTD